MTLALDDIIEQEFKFLSVNGQALKLLVSSSLFMPNQTTAAIAEAVKTYPNEIGIELGSGTGPLTVILASQPIQHLYSIEIIPEQYELACKNIEKYNLTKKVTLLQGNIFEPLNSDYPDLKADFIVSDISGMAEEPARALGWYPQAVPAGGIDGTEKIIPLIKQSSNYLKENGRLYFPVVINFSDSEKIIKSARECFQNLELVNAIKIPLTKDLLTIVDSLRSGLYAEVERKGSRGYWHLEVYEATMPKILRL